MKKVELGDILIAVNECLMDGTDRAALTVGAQYQVVSIGTSRFSVFDDENSDHYFDLKDFNLYFKYKDATDKQVGGDHYKQLAIQPVEFIQKNGLKYCEANAIKYICRHRSKNGVQDIDKAIHYLELLKELEYKL